MDVHRHSDRDEEEAQQQALERLDVRLQLMAIFGIGQQHPGQKRAEGSDNPAASHRAAVPTTIISAAAVKTSGVRSAADHPQQRPHQKTAAAEYDRNRGGALGHIHPGNPIGHVVAGQRGSIATIGMKARS